MGVLAILVAILLTGMGKIQEMGNRTGSANNLRQQGVALGAYAADHDQRLPTRQYSPYNEYGRNWVWNAITDYTGVDQSATTSVDSGSSWEAVGIQGTLTKLFTRPGTDLSGVIFSNTGGVTDWGGLNKPPFPGYTTASSGAYTSSLQTLYGENWKLYSQYLCVSYWVNMGTLFNNGAFCNRKLSTLAVPDKSILITEGVVWNYVTDAGPQPWGQRMQRWWYWSNNKTVMLYGDFHVSQTDRKTVYADKAHMYTDPTVYLPTAY